MYASVLCCKRGKKISSVSFPSKQKEIQQQIRSNLGEVSVAFRFHGQAAVLQTHR